MAQWNKDAQEYRAQDTTNFEVVNIATKDGEQISAGNPFPVSVGGTAVDAFGRLRISNPSTLFDSLHRYNDNSRWSSLTANGGSVSHNAFQSTILLNVDGAGSKVYRETKRVFSYQPGKSLYNLNSFVFATPAAGLRQRVGLFSTTNGIFLENDGTGNYIVLRSSISGSVSDANKVAQSNWNVDAFDGNGPSGITLDVSKANLMWCDIEWLGVGDVRFGFVVDGKFYIAHQFHNTNVITTVYMTTAALPVRYEIENVSATGSATLKQVCSTVMSEGGYEKRVAAITARRTASTTVGSSFEPLVSIRLKAGREDAIIMPHNFSALPTTSGNFEVALIRNATLTNASFGDMTETPNVQYDTSATAMTGGQVIVCQYVTSTNQGSTVISSELNYNWDLQLGRDQSNVSDIYTLAARTFSGTDDIIGSMCFYDLT